MKRSKWDQRIQRADELTGAHPFAADVLQFYKQIASFQKALYSYVQQAPTHQSENRASALSREDLNLRLVLPKFPEFLSHVEAVAPRLIAQSAGALRKGASSQWEHSLSCYWETTRDFQPDPGQTEALLAWMFLQPYAEYLADRSEHVPYSESSPVCPFCSGKPLVGVLRPEGDGAKRSLICAICSTEWMYRRIVCPGCGEEAIEKLATYTATQFHHVRVEACDSCRNYIKTVDLTKNGLAVPVVDELATIPLNLWAQQHGYGKLQPNLIGI